MSNFAYVAFDARGQQTKGILTVGDQLEAMARLKEMGYFPTRVVEIPTPQCDAEKPSRKGDPKQSSNRSVGSRPALDLGRKRIGARQLAMFTRQLATLVEAGMPLLRGLRLLQEQEGQGALGRVINNVAASIEGGGTLSEGLAQHPKVFNGLYLNMVRACELGGVLDVVLRRLAEFIEKLQRIKGKIVAASFYPAAVMVVAVTIMGLLTVFVVPRFTEVFKDLMDGKPLPGFTQFILNISDFVRHHLLLGLGAVLATAIGFRVFIGTRLGRQLYDRCKLSLPIIGRVVRKAAVARFTRTFGTLAASGVPILQALTIVKETSGNVVVRDAVGAVHESIKQGETIAAPLRTSGVFPAMVVGMVEIGEQTGALPEMLMKIADIYDDEVDNAVTAMTSLLEPVLIVFLAMIVGSIVIALFLPILDIINGDTNPNGINAEV